MPLFKGEDMSRVAIIHMLRCSNRPFPQDLRDVLANFLTALWWPAKGSHKKQRRLDYEAALLMETRDLIELLAAAQHEDTNDPNTQAAELVAKHYGMKLELATQDAHPLPCKAAAAGQFLIKICRLPATARAH